MTRCFILLKAHFYACVLVLHMLHLNMFYCVIPYSEYQEKNIMIVLKSYEAVTAMAVVLVAPPVNEW